MRARNYSSIGKWLLLMLAVVLAVGSLTGCGLFDAEEDTASNGSSGAVTTEPDIGAVPPETQTDGTATEEGERGATSPGYAGAGDDASKVADEDRLIIRNTGVRLRVDDITAAVASVRALTSQFGGSITSLQVSSDEDTPIYDYAAVGSLADGEPLSGYITVRVPADKLTEFNDRVSELGTVLQQSADESDVTQEHIDLTARLKNLQAQEARLRDFFDAAKKVEEMLAIEQELGRVRGEIEAMQAQIAYLERQAAMATVTIQLVRPAPLISGDEERSGFREAVKEGFAAAADLLQYGLTIVIAMSPLWIPAAVIIGIIVVLRRSRRRRWAAAQPPVSQEPGANQAPGGDYRTGA